MNDAEFHNEYPNLTKPVYWEIVEPSYIVSGLIDRTIPRAFDVKLRILVGECWMPVDLTANSILGRWLVGDYVDAQAKKAEAKEKE